MNGDTIVDSENLSARGLDLSQVLEGDDERLFRQDDNLGEQGDIITANNLNDVDGPPNDFGWDNDAAYLHFEPQMETGIMQTGVEFQIVPFSDEVDTTPRKKKVKPTKRPGPPIAEASPTKATPKKRALKKVAGKQEEQEDSEAWETSMKERLMQDHILHLRILRYEVCCL